MIYDVFSEGKPTIVNLINVEFVTTSANLLHLLLAQLMKLCDQTCASNPCTVFPFTGTCTNRTGNLGVLCDYGEEAICYPGDCFKKGDRKIHCHRPQTIARRARRVNIRPLRISRSAQPVTYRQKEM